MRVMREKRTSKPVTPYESNTTLREIADALDAADSVAITTHAKPDGDALGAVIALGRALEMAGKRVERWVVPPVTPALRVLTGGVPLHYRTDPADPLPTSEPDRILVADTGAWNQLELMRPWLEPRRDRTIVIDHHLRGDDVGALRYIDPKAAAACEIVAQLIDLMRQPFDNAVSTALFVGIATDTGWFRFANTRPETHQLAARLLRNGVNHAELHARLEQTERPEKLQLIKRALDGLTLFAGGRAALMTLRQSDFHDTGARPEETERLVDLPQTIGGVRVVVLITEVPDGLLRLSFRSKPGPNAIDVNQLARQFNGGGHARAAGARTNQPLEQVRQHLLETIEALCNS